MGVWVLPQGPQLSTCYHSQGLDGPEELTVGEAKTLGWPSRVCELLDMKREQGRCGWCLPSVADSISLASVEDRMPTASENTARWASQAAPPAVPFQGQHSTQSQDFWNSYPHFRYRV